MRLLVMYDLPMTTLANKKSYQTFHKFLIKDGYDMVQFSLYSRLCNGQDMYEKHLLRLRKNAPSRGNIRVVKITEKQYESMLFIVGSKTAQELLVIKQNKQLMLF